MTESPAAPPAAQPAAPPGALTDRPSLDRDHARRIAAVLADPQWRWLTEAVRAAWEADLSRTRVRVDLDRLDEGSTAAMADFLGWPTHRTGRVTVSLTRLDALLLSSGLAAGLAPCLLAAGGPLRDEAGERRARAGARRAADDSAWSAARSHPACQRHPALVDWLAAERRAGKLPADPPVRARVLRDALAVVHLLPHSGTSLGQLASRALGSAHALDSGAVPVTVLRALAHLAGQPAVPADAAGQRALWASVGVARDSVSSTVLVLNLRLPGEGPLPVTLSVHADHGIPVRLTLDQLQRYLDSSPPPPSRYGLVSVCENPSVVEAAAQRLGAGCGPLLSVEGRPSVAATRLVAHLIGAGCALRYHGDFDWPGLAIAADLVRAGAAPWRMAAPDYLAALPLHPDLPRLPVAPPNVETAWDAALTEAMRRHRRQVEEEHVIDDLLTDIAGSV
ncbi:MAG TPA: TIGR02679 family protein [Pilimelia sp.]|nr:TIGR02679 family protein [Pilimelia sp.]